MSVADTNSGQLIKSIVERIERLDEEIKGLNEDKRDVFVEAKGNGLDTKAIKRLVAYRRKGRDVAQEEDAVFELYLQAIEKAESAPPPSRTRTKPASSGLTMTMSTTSPETGEVTTTPPFTTEDLKRAVRQVKTGKPAGAADIDYDDPFGG